MKYKNTLIITFLLTLSFTLSINATTYYVSTSGNDSNDGESENSSWQTIKYAASQVQAGDTVYVKAGIYNDESVSFTNNGSSGNLITLEGYKVTPGDIDNIDWWQYGNELNASEMPLLDGGDRASGTAFKIYSKNYIKIKNFQITNYEIALSYYQTNNSFAENIIAENFGDVASSYSGKGISLNSCNNNIFKNCVIVNAGAEGIGFTGSDNILDGCKVYCDQGYTGQPDVHAATDYYIVLAGDNNLLKNCYIERVGNLDHGGAGIGIKGSGKYNLFENCTAKNLRNSGFYVRHSAVTENTFNNCTAIGGISGDGFIIRDGAHHNTFNYCRTDSCQLAVAFYDTDEDGINNAGMYNDFNNCIFENTQHAIIAFAGDNEESKAEYNNFVNCVFNNGENLFNTGRMNTNNEMINCIVSNIKNYKYVLYTRYREINFKFSYTNFWKNDFEIPYDTLSTYENTIFVNPRFADAENGDYHLEYNSQCIDAGQPDMSEYNLPELDYYDNPRFFDSKENGMAIIDMGIHEFPAITDVEDAIAIPKKFTLFNNYPNPFNPSTNISYYLDNSTNVKISIYDSVGRLVEILFNDFQSVGKHTIEWNAANVSSGVYFYKVETSTSTNVKSCLLLK